MVTAWRAASRPTSRGSTVSNIPGDWGSINIDDEGTPAQRKVLIENGVLKSYMIDKFNGRRMGMASTGSARRQSFSYVPTSRMTNTFIAPGTDRDEDIIASIEYGLYAKSMGGGSVNPVTGEFKEPQSPGMVPSSMAVTFSWAIFCPSLPQNWLLP